NQSGIPFLLNGKDLARTKITVDIKNVSLERGLFTIFEERPITWEISDGTIIVRNSKTKNQPSSSETAPQEQTIMGHVTNEQGTPIPGASVQVKGTSEGTITNEEGDFSVTANTNSIIRVSDRKSTRLNSSHVKISYAVFCLKKK